MALGLQPDCAPLSRAAIQLAKLLQELVVVEMLAAMGLGARYLLFDSIGGRFLLCHF